MSIRFMYIVFLLISIPWLSSYGIDRRDHHNTCHLIFTDSSKEAVADTTNKNKQQKDPKIKEVAKAKRLPKPEKVDEDQSQDADKKVKPKRQRRPPGMERPPEIPRHNGG